MDKKLEAALVLQENGWTKEEILDLFENKETEKEYIFVPWYPTYPTTSPQVTWGEWTITCSGDTNLED